MTRTAPLLFKEGELCSIPHAAPSVTERILQLCRYLAVLRTESIILVWLLNPSLAEHKEKVVPGPRCPPGTGLPAQIPRLVVVLNEVRDRQGGRSGVACPPGQDSSDEIALRQAGKCLVG